MKGATISYSKGWTKAIKQYESFVRVFSKASSRAPAL
jgi:hypothetical protein